METFADRFNFAFMRECRRREEAGEPKLLKQHVVKAAGVTRGAFAQWADGSVKMTLDKCILASHLLRCNPYWLFGGKGKIDADGSVIDLESHPDLSPVKRVSIHLSAGIDGYEIQFHEEEAPPVFFRRDWMRQHGYKADRLVAVRVKGQSMETGLWAGDLVVINLDDVEPKDGEVFAVNYEGQDVIKRLSRDAGDWWLTSDNADQRRYPKKLCTQDVKIIGRVVYKQSEVI
jgi:hypothetical protein